MAHTLKLLHPTWAALLSHRKRPELTPPVLPNKCFLCTYYVWTLHKPISTYISIATPWPFFNIGPTSFIHSTSILWAPTMYWALYKVLWTFPSYTATSTLWGGVIIIVPTLHIHLLSKFVLSIYFAPGTLYKEVHTFLLHCCQASLGPCTC